MYRVRKKRYKPYQKHQKNRMGAMQKSLIGLGIGAAVVGGYFITKYTITPAKYTIISAYNSGDYVKKIGQQAFQLLPKEPLKQ